MLHYFINEYDPNTHRWSFLEGQYLSINDAVMFLSTVSNHFDYGTFHDNDPDNKSKSYQLLEGYQNSDRPVVDLNPVIPPLSILEDYGYEVYSDHPDLQLNVEELGGLFSQESLVV